MPNSTPTRPELLAQSFGWFRDMCKEVQQIVAKDTPGSSALVVLELGEDISDKLHAEYSAMVAPNRTAANQSTAISPDMLTSLPPALTSRQIALFFGKYDPPVLTRIASQFLTYTGQDVYDNAVMGEQAKEYLDMASKNIADFAAYVGTLTQIATESQARIALAKALYNQQTKSIKS